MKQTQVIQNHEKYSVGVIQEHFPPPVSNHNNLYSETQSCYSDLGLEIINMKPVEPPVNCSKFQTRTASSTSGKC